MLADEINRATPKTQSALLEAMEEGQMTVDGVTYRLSNPFLIMATQNPIEYEGTFPLPEAQLDRFLIRIQMGYPQPQDELNILASQQYQHPIQNLQQVVTLKELARRTATDQGCLCREGSAAVHRQPDHGVQAARRCLPRQQPARLIGALPHGADARGNERTRLRHSR